MADPTLTTRLMAVNTMLEAIGEAPLADLTDPSDDVTLAEQILDRVNVEVQLRGWKFNVEEEVVLSPVAGVITLATNVARVDVIRTSAGDADIVFRDGKLYDLKAKSDSLFTVDVKATILFLFEFIKLPESARQYIQYRAARKFGELTLGDRFQSALTRSNEADAWRTMNLEESETGDWTMFDNLDTANAILRYAPLDRIYSTR